ncbi:MAG: hypothetical protein U0U70_12940 [Chitinophagaceae bacterium]
MTIETIDKNIFLLLGDDRRETGRITYSLNDYSRAEIITAETSLLAADGTGTWRTTFRSGGKEKTMALTRIKAGSLISITLECRKKRYSFARSTGWKLRFILLNREGEEILSILPAISWEKESHNYILQLNEEFEGECDPFLILQAVHCANLSMSMLNGGKVPALISI